MNADLHACPLCDKRPVYSLPVGRKLWFEYECPRCGQFTITREAQDDLPGWEQEDPLIRKRLRRYLWDRRPDEMVLISDGRFEEEGYTVMDIRSGMKLYHDDGSPLGKLDRALANLARRTERLGEVFTDDNRWDIPTMDDDEAALLVRGLIDQGYAQGDVFADGSWRVALTTEGLRRAQDLGQGLPASPAEIMDVSSSGIPSVFLSHSHQDNLFVERLAADLEREGIKVWYDGWDLEIGHDLTVKIQEGIESSQFLAVVLSPDAARSAWVEKEWTTAFTDELATRRVKVLPILHRECQIPAFLRGKKWVDFRNEAQYGDRLVELVRRIRGERPPRGG